MRRAVCGRYLEQMRALSSFVILAAAIAFGVIYVVHDGVIDVGRFVHFVPIAAAGVAVASIFARRLVSGRRRS